MSKVILISGGSDGLGKAIAKKLVPNNQVVILAHNRTKLEAAAKELGCDFVEAEMTDFNSLQSAVDQTISKYQKIDVLVNNAGIWIEGQLDQNDPSKINEIINVNTTGTIFLTKAILPHFRSQKTGLVINIISQDGLGAKKDRSVYHASKWAITGFTKCLQEDLCEEEIKVTAIYPGLIKTNLFQKSGVDRDLTEALDPAELANVVDYVINLSPGTYIPEISIKNKKTQPKNMDDTSTPSIDLNIDPDMITPSSNSPQVISPIKAPYSPLTPLENTGTIDITPGEDTPASLSETNSTHISFVPGDLSSVETPQEIQGQIPTPTETVFSPSLQTPYNMPTTTNSQTTVPTVETHLPPTPPTSPTSPTGPLSEDPDTVKLIK